VLLNFPDGLIPIRVLKNEFFTYLYDPVAEGQLPGEVPPSASSDGASRLGFVRPQLLRSAIIASQPINVLVINDKSILYQVFVGIAPSPARVFFAIPSTAAQRNLEVINWSEAYAAAGFIDGFTSPLLYPAPESEFVLTYQLDVALGYANPLFEPIRPLLMFYVNRVKFGVVADPDLVLEMLDMRGRGEKTKIKVVGGMTAFTYDYRNVFQIRPIPIGATRNDVIARLRGG
ncbi:MAG: hypothetical protein QXU62_08930, partial [Thermofilaceae archaeon]